MRRHSLAIALIVGAWWAAGCSPGPKAVTVNVGEVRMKLVPPRGWEHVDNGGRHEFRNGDVRMTLEDEGVATPESLAGRFRAARAVLETGRDREAIERLSERDDPVLAARDRDVLGTFWREWNSVAYDPTRRSPAELTTVLDQLIERAGELSPIDGHTYAMWTVIQELDTTRYQIAGIAPVNGDSSAWWLARTWTRVAHTYPRRFASRVVDGRLILLDSGNFLPPEAEKVFDELLSSIEPADDGP